LTGSADRTAVVTQTAEIWTAVSLTKTRYKLSDIEQAFVGEGAYNYAGFAVAGAGDVNADGLDDFLIGAHGNDQGGGTPTHYSDGAGKSYLILGRSPADWGRNFSLASADASFVGQNAYDFSGYALDGVGDFNGDGFDDFIIAAPNAAFSDDPLYYYDPYYSLVFPDGGAELNGAGRDYLVLGKPAGWQTNTLLANADTVMSGGVQWVTVFDRLFGWTYKVFVGGNAGRAVSGIGDLNQDGFDDFVVGAPLHDGPDFGGLYGYYYDFVPALDYGKTYVLFGSQAVPAVVSLESSSNASFYGMDQGGKSGWSIEGLDDANGDGFDDFIVGAPGDTVGGYTGGRSFLFLGHRDNWANDRSNLYSNGILVAESPFDEFGRVVAGIGDVNGDGNKDIGVGAFLNDTGTGTSNTGKSYAIFLRAVRQEADYVRHLPTGEQTNEDFSATRVQIQYAGGSASGDKMTRTNLNRTSTTLGNRGLGQVVNIQWEIQAERSNYTASARFHYLDTEIPAQTDEADLRLYKADNADGPWSYVETQSTHPNNNTVIAELSDFSHFAIAGGLAELQVNSPLDFGAVELGAAPVGPLTATLTNVGTADLVFKDLGDIWPPSAGKGIDIVEDPADQFAIVNTVDSTTDLAPRESRDVEIVFTPKQLGLAGANLAVYTENEMDESKLTVPLKAVVYEASRPYPLINLETPPGAEVEETLRIYGDDKYDGLGSELANGMAFGDVNGDGFDDLIIGADRADPEGRLGAGEAYIIYDGELDSLEHPVVNLDTDGVLSNRETRILGRAADDRAGWSVASGDVNGDGFDDVIIGANKASPVGRESAGEVYVVYGRPDMRSRVFDLGEIDNDLLRGKTRIYGGRYDDSLGWSVASGDINADGYDDVIIGAIHLARTDIIPEDWSRFGGVYVIYGSPSLPNQIYDLDEEGVPKYGETIMLPGADEIMYPPTYGSRTGWSVASADFDGDGIDDVIIGARDAERGEPDNFVNNVGKVYVVYGADDGSLADAKILLDQDPGVTRIFGDDAGDHMGVSVAGGDVNADGYDDLVIGASQADSIKFGSEGDDTGEVYIVYGQTGRPADIELNNPTTKDAVAAGETRILGNNPGDRAGWSVAAGDVNGDGYDDVVIGATQADPYGKQDAGELYVVYGNAGKPGTASNGGSFVNLDPALSGADVAVLGAYTGDHLGYGALAGGDLNRSGFSDFAAAARYGDNPSIDTSLFNNAGVAFLICGDGTASSASVIERFKAGAVPPVGLPLRGLGGRLSPVIRARIAPASGNAGPIMATIAKTDAGVSGLGDGSLTDVADVIWEISHGRGFVTSNELTLQYTDEEIDDVNERTLELWTAQAKTGPWALVGVQSLSMESNTIRATIPNYGFFALKGAVRTGAQGWKDFE
jgi:hypothetical protein